MSRGLPVAPHPVRWAGVLACAGLILVASVLDTGSGPQPTVFGIGLSLYLHLVAYAGLAGAIGYALLGVDRRALAVAAAGAVLFGVGVELVQAPIPYRTASTLDVLVNGLGAALGAAVWRAVAPMVGAHGTGDGTTSI